MTAACPCARPVARWLLAVGLTSLSGCGNASPFDRTASTSEGLQQCAGPTVEGIDIYEGTGLVTWSAVKTAGIDFAIIKATQGTYNTQSTFPAFWMGAKAAGLVRSAYHFFDPTEDGVAQAQHFLSVVGALATDDLPAMLDIECPDGSANCLYSGASGDAGASDIHQRMWDWIDTVQKATGKAPLIYTYGSYFSSNGIDTAGLAAYPLNIADITTGSCFNVPSPWTKAAVWQYSWTGTVNGIQAQVDRDRFLGTLSDLQAFARGGPSAAQNEADDAMARAPSDARVEASDSEAGRGIAADGSLVGEAGPIGADAASSVADGAKVPDGAQGAAVNASENRDAGGRASSAAANGGLGGSSRGDGCGCRVEASPAGGGVAPEERRVAGIFGLSALMAAIARRRKTASDRSADER